MSIQISNRIEVLDGWRGLAVLLVLIGHFTFSKWIWEERMGVDIFFVLSGLLMAKILFVDRMSLKDFYIRRLSRIMPVLIVFLAVATALSIVLQYDFSMVEIISSLLFIRTYFPPIPEYFATPTPTGHLWSLSVEEHSYVLMSLMSVFLLARKKIAILLLGIYALSVAINLSNMFSMSAQQFEFSLIRTESAIGFIAFSAGYSLLKRERSISLPKHIPFVFVILALACYVKAVPIWLTFTLCPVLLGVAVNHISDNKTVFQTVLRNPVFRYLGIFSYSIYLWQQVFYKLYYVLPYGQITGFIASIAVGVGSFYLLEDPIRHYINNKWSANPTYRSQELSATQPHATNELEPSNSDQINESLGIKTGSNTELNKEEPTTKL